MQKILIIDNDFKATTRLKELLEREGLMTYVSSLSDNNLKTLLSIGFDCVVLEPDLPEAGTIDLLINVRQKSAIPLLVWSKNTKEDFKVSCLEAGSDDCVSKKVSYREVTARIKAILSRVRQAASSQNSRIETRELTVEPGLHQATLKGNRLKLTGIEFNIIYIMARNAGHVVDKNQLSLLALRRPLLNNDRSIDVHISSIRNKMHQYSSEDYIKTVRGQGYLLASSI